LVDVVHDVRWRAHGLVALARGSTDGDVLLGRAVAELDDGEIHDSLWSGAAAAVAREMTRRGLVEELKNGPRMSFAAQMDNLNT
jgi:hypothetical protein